MALRLACTGAMKKALEIPLGIVTSIGGFLDVGVNRDGDSCRRSFWLRLIVGHSSRHLCIIFIIEMV
jgi:hypothetical protein